ncbi:MAG: hypothetical protein FWG43_01790 [Clostridiales bacterium]|nr:hypothetical protein [Clostridiales bacterium]
MNDEKQKVLDMLGQGQINADEAARLLECLDIPSAQEEQAAGEGTQLISREGTRSANNRLTGKKLRVEVKGHVEKDKKMDINVSVPLVLARYVDDLLASCLPEAANRELMAQGINLRQLNISQLVDALESLDEDIVNADINQDDMKLKVRVYVE